MIPTGLLLPLGARFLPREKKHKPHPQKGEREKMTSNRTSTRTMMSLPIALSACVALLAALLAAAGCAAPRPPASPATTQIPALDLSQLPGKVIFEGTYTHRSRGSEYSAPGRLRLTQTEDGAITAIAEPPLLNTTYVAFGDKRNRLTRYRIDAPGYDIILQFEEGKLLRTQRGIRQDEDAREIPVPTGAAFDPNTRPDPYCAANILLRGLALEEGQTKELEVFDYDNTGDGYASYKLKVQHAGKEEVAVPAGRFEANHLLLTQLTSANTWFKKRAGHVTDFWVLDNGVIVRILRHREPYELQLLHWKTPSTLPGLKEGTVEQAGARLEIVHAEYGAGENWIDVTEHLRKRVVNNSLVLTDFNQLAGDPLYGVLKELTVQYRLDGRPYYTAVREGETLRIPDAAVQSQQEAAAQPMKPVPQAAHHSPEQDNLPNPPDHLLGWFKMTDGDTIIPVFKRDGTYYSVCRGFEIPLKECPEGLEWVLTPSSMVGTMIGFDEASNAYYIIIEDQGLASNYEPYISGEKQPMVRIDKPSWLLDPTALPPRTNDDFLGHYRAIWFPWFRFEIRKEGESYFGAYQMLSETGLWEPEGDPDGLAPLPDRLGFTGFDRETRHILTYNEALKRFELTNSMPLARVTPSSWPEADAVRLPTMRIGIPSWH